MNQIVRNTSLEQNKPHNSKNTVNRSKYVSNQAMHPKDQQF